MKPACSPALQRALLSPHWRPSRSSPRRRAPRLPHPSLQPSAARPFSYGRCATRVTAMQDGGRARQRTSPGAEPISVSGLRATGAPPPPGHAALLRAFHQRRGSRGHPRLSRIHQARAQSRRHRCPARLTLRSPALVAGASCDTPGPANNSRRCAPQRGWRRRPRQPGSPLLTTAPHARARRRGVGSSTGPRPDATALRELREVDAGLSMAVPIHA